MPRAKAGGICVVAVLWSALTTAELLADEVVTLDTRPGVRQSFLVVEPSGAPKGVVLLFPGHEGVVRFEKNGDRYVVGGEGGGLSGSEAARLSLRDKGLVAAILAPPSDRANGMDSDFRYSNEHAQDVHQVISYLNKRYHGKTYLHGHCRSSYSPASVATKLDNDGIAGLILSSTRSRGSHGSVMDFAKGAVKVPVLLVHHTADPCPGTPYSGVRDLKRFYEAAAPRVDVITVSGGDLKKNRRGKCAGGAHAFKGVQQETMDAITRWLLDEEFPTHIDGKRM